MEDSYIIGVSQYNTKKLTDYSIVELSSYLLDSALKDASSNLNKSCIEGLLSMHPGSNSDEIKYASTNYAIWLATKLNLQKPINKPFITKNCYAGGATPISLCLHANDLLLRTNSNCIAIIITQRPNSVNRSDYIEKIKNYFYEELQSINADINKIQKYNISAIPLLYDAYTTKFLKKYGKTIA